MGCTSSKQARRDRRQSPAPYIRTYSAPINHRSLRNATGNQAGGGTHHVVALTSSTLGSLNLDPCPESDEEMMKTTNDRTDLVQAKAWSEMIDRRIPKTPNRTPPNEPETINAWELMEGLEDAAPVAATVGRSFSFHSSSASKPSIGFSSPKPLWMQLAPEESIVSDFDPEIISNFRKALDELSPQHPLASSETTKPAGIVKARINAFQQRIDAKKANNNASKATKVAPCCKCPPNGEKKVVFYFTSLRGVRKTYEDCWGIRVILQGYNVKVDERDVSMHGGFKEELDEILGYGFGGSQLPRVFANGKYLGGADDVKQMHEAGELWKELEECEVVPMGKGGVGRSCEGCGDVRFVPCENCSGSCKVFVEQEEEEEGEEEVGEFRRCPDCNENGLIRCPICC